MAPYRNITILVVDDDAMLREAVSSGLQQQGFTTICASSGKEALEIVKSQHVNLVISDIRMPNGDGMFLLENLRACVPSQPPLIFVTGGSPYTESECLEKGAVKVLAKPFAVQELYQSVVGALNLSHSSHAA